MNDEQWTIDHRDMNFGFRISDFGIFIPHSAFPACPAGGRIPQSKGFTLIELILIMVMIGILAAIVIPKMNVTLTSGTPVSGAANMIASDIRYTQEWAMATRNSRTVSFASGQSSYTSPVTGSPIYLPSGVTISNDFSVTFNSLGEPITTTPAGTWSVGVSAGVIAKTITVVNYTGKVNIT